MGKYLLTWVFFTFLYLKFYIFDFLLNRVSMFFHVSMDHQIMLIVEGQL